MDDLSACTIDTRIVYGFSGAGKTSYITDCIMNDYFHKYGKTLILCFQQGEEVYDTEALSEKNTCVAFYDNKQEIKDFCLEQLEKHKPERIYVEMNTKLPTLRNMFPDMMNVTSCVTLFDWDTFDWYYECFKQEISQMVSESIQVTFRGCPSKELLVPYSQQFRLMNPKASYLRQDPMGFHEKAFDLFVPYSLDENNINIREADYLIFWLDATDHPEHYDGKEISFADPLEIRQPAEGSPWSAGRVVMTCCMADLQFMSFELMTDEPESLHGGWATIDAAGRVEKDEYGRRVLKLGLRQLKYAAAPESGMILQAR